MNLQRGGALQTNAVRHADFVAMILLLGFNASHIRFSLEICPSEEVFEGNRNYFLLKFHSFKYSIAW
jgi:hypothetical protein